MPWYTPSDSLTDESREKGLKVFTWESLGSHAMTILVTGAFLPGMALALGANKFIIGLLASFAPIAQMAQIPAVLVIEKVGLRKLISVVSAVLSRVFLIAAAFVPFIAPEEHRVGLFTLFMILFFIGGSFAGCSTASLIRDLLPEDRRGSLLASRLAGATALGAALSLAGGFSVEPLARSFGGQAGAYAIIFLIAAAFGIVAAVAVGFMPEPRMQKSEAGAKWLKRLITPMRDPNFRRLLIFSASWSFTVIMSGAFFAVYILDRIGIPMSGIIMLAMLSQVMNIYFFRVWGRIADHFSNKSVLAVTVPLFIVLLLMYPFTTMPEQYGLTIPLLILIHIIGGISTAGFNLCAANIALRLAPHGNATSYLGTNAFCAGLAAAIAPVVGGALGAYFSSKEISIDFFYRSDVKQAADTFRVSAVSFRGLDFVFFASALTGLYAWHRLSLIDEEGTVSEKAVREQVFLSVKNSVFTSSGLNMGMRRMTAFPYEMLRRTHKGATSTLTRAAKGVKGVAVRKKARTGAGGSSGTAASPDDPNDGREGGSGA